MQIRAADTTAFHLDIDIVLFPRLGLELLPDHLAIGRVLVETHPSLELVVGLSHDHEQLNTWNLGI